MSAPPVVDLSELIHLFYEDASQLGRFSAVGPESLRDAYDRLLNHEGHMTVTVESFYKSLVDVHVERCSRVGRMYAREITLVKQSDRETVQYGIVRLNTSLLEPAVWREIESQEKPLGRVLIEHGVLRQVQLCELWKVTAGPALARLLQMDEGGTTFGRTAWIICNQEPAIELLEIVRPPKDVPLE